MIAAAEASWNGIENVEWYSILQYELISAMSELWPYMSATSIAHFPLALLRRAEAPALSSSSAKSHLPRYATWQ